MDKTFCQVHGVAKKQVPGGVSKKTGKTYEAFYSCDACYKESKSGSKASVPVQPQTAVERAKMSEFQLLSERITHLEARLDALEGKTDISSSLPF